MKNPNTTLVYIYKGDDVLMLHRDKKENDENAGKWIGVGGHFEENESPEECMIREVREETGLCVNSWKYRGIVTFVSEKYGCEYMHLFTTDDFSGEIIPCNEGTLEWIHKDRLLQIPHWAGDEIFLNILRDDDAHFFSLKLTYGGTEADHLQEAILNGKQLTI